jgi:hypothetical protein
VAAGAAAVLIAVYTLPRVVSAILYEVETMVCG